MDGINAFDQGLVTIPKLGFVGAGLNQVWGATIDNADEATISDFSVQVFVKVRAEQVPTDVGTTMDKIRGSERTIQN